MYKKYTAVISLSFIVSAVIAATILQLNYAYAQKAETLDFLETVRNIAHDDVFVQLRITGGITQNFTIDGNPSNLLMLQLFKSSNSQLPRQSTTPGIPPLKIGDEYFACYFSQGYRS